MGCLSIPVLLAVTKPRMGLDSDVHIRTCTSTSFLRLQLMFVVHVSGRATNVRAIVQQLSMQKRFRGVMQQVTTLQEILWYQDRHAMQWLQLHNR